MVEIAKQHRKRSFIVTSVIGEMKKEIEYMKTKKLNTLEKENNVQTLTDWLIESDILIERLSLAIELDSKVRDVTFQIQERQTQKIDFIKNNFKDWDKKNNEEKKKSFNDVLTMLFPKNDS